MTEEKTKTCIACHRQLPPGAFGKSIMRPDGLHNTCRECRRKKYREQTGGLQHALRNFSNADLVAELIRREAADEMLSAIPREVTERCLSSSGDTGDDTPPGQSAGA